MNDRVANLSKLFRMGDLSQRASGYRVRLVREALGYSNSSRRAFSAIIGTTWQNLESIENGKSYPRPKFLYAIYLEYRIGPSFILFGEWDTVPAGAVEIMSNFTGTGLENDPTKA